MILRKSCPRCVSGDIIVRAEGTYTVASCLQCGYRREFVPGYGLTPSAAFIRDALARERELSGRVETLH
jgi:hypothetical protein